MPKWTPEQKLAIDEEGYNIIVSAGAGSGKTAVLTERVIRKLESGVGIDRLLILTFTNLAAAEMKNRIREKIKKRIELSDDLRKIDSSYITTFDSFALSLVKKYHYLLNVKKNVNIIDSNLLDIKIKEYLDMVFDEEYQEKQADFYKLIDDFCIKDDTNIREAILYLNKKLDLKYDKKEYLENYLDNYYNDKKVYLHIEEYITCLKEIIQRIDDNLRRLYDEVSIDYATTLKDILTNLLNSDNYEEIKKSVLISLPNIPRGSSDTSKNIKKKISDDIKLLTELTKYEDTNKIYESINLTKPYVQSIIRIVLKLDDKLNNYKEENDLYDFIDISKMAIRLVKEHKNIREEIKNSFNEIMVDEYQDTSDLQEEFISEISNNNVYMVGDIKQSIYRFRNANPDIFRNKYKNYSESINGKKIDLLDNFRSRQEVVDGINLLFQHIMSEDIGGANYLRDHEMHFGNKEYEKEGKVCENNNLELLSYDTSEIYSSDEIEAFIIAKDIENKVVNHFQVYDKKNKSTRDIRYDDFAILIDRSENFELFKKVFLYKQIPLSIYQDEKLTNSSLFLSIRSIFKLINLVYEKNIGKEMEYAFLSIGRSFLCRYSDQELFNIIKENNYQKTEIMKKVNEIIINIDSKTITMIIDEIISKFDVYENLRRIPDIESNYVKLEYLYTFANNLNQMGYTFKDFDKFLNDVLESDTEIKFSMNKEDGESVKIMTIHASKGLEYPICYYPALAKKINDKEIKKRILFQNDLGIIAPFNDEGMDDTIYRELLKRIYYQEEISEKIRLLYVAVTRAREKMIFILPKSDNIEELNTDIVPYEERISYRSFLDIINSIKSRLLPYIKDIDLQKLGLTKEYNYINNKNLFKNINKIKNELKMINYPKFVFAEKEEKHFSKSSVRLFTKKEKEQMEFGSKIHYYLETLDFNNIDLHDIEKIYQEKIMAFLESDLMKNKDNAKIYQEYEFIDDDVNGIIDLMMEYDDYIDIIDYKLKNISDEAYLKQLNGYRDYIHKLTKKDINIYLYSLMDEKYQKL